MMGFLGNMNQLDFPKQILIFGLIWWKNLAKPLAILCDLFGMVKWPFQGVSDLQLGDEKVTFESSGL